MFLKIFLIAVIVQFALAAPGGQAQQVYQGQHPQQQNNPQYPHVKPQHQNQYQQGHAQEHHDHNQVQHQQQRNQHGHQQNQQGVEIDEVIVVKPGQSVKG